MRDDDPRVLQLEADGWRVAHTSWAARLRLGDDRKVLRAAVRAAAAAGFEVMELGADEDAALVALDAATRDDYPGGPATAHVALDPVALAERRAGGIRFFGAFTAGALVAVTAIRQEGATAETDFTAVLAGHRRRGLATAVKAASVLALADRGVTVFGTGGAAENAGSLAANHRLGYVITERWRTYSR